MGRHGAPLRSRRKRGTPGKLECRNASRVLRLLLLQGRDPVDDRPEPGPELRASVDRGAQRPLGITLPSHDLWPVQRIESTGVCLE
jgi:hypothetical protein